VRELFVRYADGPLWDMPNGKEIGKWDKWEYLDVWYNNGWTVNGNKPDRDFSELFEENDIGSKMLNSLGSDGWEYNYVGDVSKRISD